MQEGMLQVLATKTYSQFDIHFHVVRLHIYRS